MKARVMMELINESGNKRLRELTMLRKDYKEGGQQKYFIYFHGSNKLNTNPSFKVYNKIQL